MKNNSSKSKYKDLNNDLHELFLGDLADLLGPEQRLTKVLPKMARAAKSEELAEAFKSHLEDTEGHVSRLEKIFKSLDEPAKPKKRKAMEGLIDDGMELMKEEKDSPAIA